MMETKPEGRRLTWREETGKQNAIMMEALAMEETPPEGEASESADTSQADYDCQDCCTWYISPKNPVVRAWEDFVIFTVFISVLFNVFLASISSGAIGLWVLSYFCDIIYVLDICKQFLQSYEVNGILIQRRGTACQLYGKRTFILDLLSVLPLEAIFPLIPNRDILEIMAKLRINRMIRFYRIFTFFSIREAELGSNTPIILTVKYFFVCCTMTHCLSCGWYGMACHVADTGMTRICLNDSWVYNFDIGMNISHAEIGDVYALSFYWAMATATSTGYGDISASNYPEKWFAIAGMLFGISVFFGMLLGGMTSLLTNLGAQRAQFAHRLETIKLHLTDESVSEDLLNTVLRYYEYIWVRKRGVTSDGMFDPLPITFQEEIALAINERIIDKAPIFRGLDVGFIRQLSMKIKPALCLPHQYIVNRGDIGQQMYYIQRGEVEILAEDDETPLAKLHKGRLIGELNLIHSLPRTASVRAATHCDLMVLERGDVHELLPHYEDVAAKLQEIAQLRITGAKLLETKEKEEQQQQRSSTTMAQRRKSRKSFSSKSFKDNQGKVTFTSAAYEVPAGLTSDRGVKSVLSKQDSLKFRQSSTMRRRASAITEEGLEVFTEGPATVAASNLAALTEEGSESEDEEVVTSEIIQVYRPPLARRCCEAIGNFFHMIFTTLINPKAKAYNVWRRFVAVTATIITFYNTFMACFAGYNQHTGYGSSSYGSALIAVGYLMDLVLIADIIVNLRTAVYTPNGIMQDTKEILKNYVKNGLFVDIISIIPIEIFCLAGSTTRQTWMLYAYFKLNRIVKMAKVASLLQELEKALDVSISTIRMIKCTMFISVLSHFLACFWFLSACAAESCRAGSWVVGFSQNMTVEEASSSLEIGINYVRSLYWAAATMTSTGYGDISASTTAGRVVAILAMITGLLLYGYCLSIIAATLANLDAPRVKYQEKLFAVKEFMIENKLNPLVTEKVVEYLVRLYSKTRGEFIPGGRPLLYDMPYGLQQDLANDDAMTLMGEVPIFRDSEESFLRAITLKAKRYLFTPGDIIIYSGDVGTEIYVIKRGYCEIMSPNLGERYAEIGPGQFFGELGVIFASKRTATVRAITYCDVLMVTKADLEELFKKFPLAGKEFEGLMANRDRYSSLFNRSTRKDDQESGLSAPTTRSAVSSILDIVNRESSQQKPSSKEITRADTPTEEEVYLGNKPDSLRKFHKRLHGVLNKEYLQPFARLNPCQKVFALLLMRWTFLPTGKWLGAWTTFRVLLAILTTVLVPVHIAFLQESIAMWAIVFILDLISVVDMYINFHIAYYDENNLLITHPISTASHYMRSNFLIDLMAILPFEFLVYAAFPSIDPSTVQLFALARLNRLIQVYRVPMAFVFLELKVEKETGFIRKIKFAFYAVILLSIVTCCLFMTACPPDLFLSSDAASIQAGSGHRCRYNSWLTRSGFDSSDGSSWLTRSGHNISDAGVGTMFVISLYWSTATAVSVGYGDIHATADIDIVEMVISLLFMIMGVVFFGYIIASVAASLANADAQRARFQKKMEMIKKFLKDQDISEPLQDRVVTYYEYIWVRTKGVDPETLFDGLPLSLWGDVTFSLYKDLLEKVALFQNTEVSFMKMLSRCIKPMLYQKGDYVVRKFDIGSEMFFINRGAVDVVSEDGSIVFATMKAGAFFGEVALLFTCPRTASIRAQTNVDMFVLSKTDLDSVLNFYPAIKEQVFKVGEERRNAAAAREKKGIDKPKAKTITTHHGPSTGPTKLRRTSVDQGKNKPQDSSESVKSEDGGSAQDVKTDQAKTEEGENKLDPIAESRPGSSVSESRPGSNTNQSAAGETEGGKEAETEVVQPEPGPLRRCCQRLYEVNNFTINPAGKFMKYFNILTTFSALLIGWTISYQAAYQDHHIAIMVINYLAEAVFIAQIYVHLHLSFRDKYGDLVEDFHAVYMNYLKTPRGFLLDFIATIPIDLLALAAPTVDMQYMVLFYLRIIHLLHLVHALRYFSKWEKELDADMLTVRMWKSLIEVGLLIHYFACIWYGIACPANQCLPEASQESWASAISANYHTRVPIEKYCDSIYWAVATMTSTGYGDISAHGVLEMLYAVIVMAAGKLLFGFVLGNIASTLANAEAQRVAYENTLSAIKSHLVDQEVPTKLKDRVVEYFDYLWIRNQGVDPKGLFKDAPYTILSEIAMEISTDMLTQITLLESADDAFFRYLAEKVNISLFMPGDYIIMQGDVCEEVFYIYKGEAETIEEVDHQEICQTLEEKSIFGEENIVHETANEVSVRARTHVDIFTLSKTDLDDVLDHYPELKQKVQELGQELFGAPIKHHGDHH